MEDAFFEEKLNELKQISDEDIDALIESAEQDSDELVIWKSLTAEFLDLGMTLDALEVIDHIIELDYDDFDIWMVKGTILNLMENHRESIKYFKKALKMNPDCMELWGVIAESYFRLDDISKALETIDEGIKINSEIPKLWAIKGNILLFSDSEFDKTLKCYNAALELDPDDEDTWHDLSYAYCMNDQYSNALDAIDQAISINPDCSDHWFSKGVTLHYMEKFKEAINSITVGMKWGNPDFDTWGALAYSYFNLRDYNNALDAVNQALESETDDSDLFSNLLTLRFRILAERHMSNKASKRENRLSKSRSGKHEEAIPYKGTTLDDFR